LCNLLLLKAYSIDVEVISRALQQTCHVIRILVLGDSLIGRGSLKELLVAIKGASHLSEIMEVSLWALLHTCRRGTIEEEERSDASTLLGIYIYESITGALRLRNTVESEGILQLTSLA
jgi:hypothetical protein